MGKMPLSQVKSGHSSSAWTLMDRLSVGELKGLQARPLEHHQIFRGGINM